MKLAKLTLSSVLAVLALTGCQHSESLKVTEPRHGYLGDNPHVVKRMPVRMFDSEVLLVRDDYDTGFEKKRPIEIVEPEPPRIYVLQSDLLFDFDKSELKPSSRQVIDQLIDDIIGAYSLINMINVDGHTDRFGTNEYNTELALRRAATVRSELIARGVNPNDIAINSYGESSPVTDGCPNLRGEEAKACLAPDRRVEIRVNGVLKPNVITDTEQQ